MLTRHRNNSMYLSSGARRFLPPPSPPRLPSHPPYCIFNLDRWTTRSFCGYRKRPGKTSLPFGWSWIFHVSPCTFDPWHDSVATYSARHVCTGRFLPTTSDRRRHFFTNHTTFFPPHSENHASITYLRIWNINDVYKYFEKYQHDFQWQLKDIFKF